MMSGVILGYTAAQVRDAEQPLLDAGPQGALMQQAAFGLAVRVSRLLVDRRGRVAGSSVVALVGPGSNGGDALHAGAELARRGAGVTVVTTSAAVHDAGLAALRAAGGTVLTVVDGGPGRPVWVGDALAEAVAADVVLDGLLGIGARGALREEAAELVTLLGELLGQDVAPAVPDVVAVDVPSGIGVDDGELPGPVLPADLTVTFGAVKAGLLLPPASGVAGDVELVDIGLDLTGVPPVAARLETSDVADLWPVPVAASHKYTRGVVGVVAGTALYPGAAVLSTSAAVLAGAGMVRYLGPPPVAQAVLAARPEVVVGHGRVQAWVLGPGVDPADEEQAAHVRDALAEALAGGLPVVADAGALGHLPEHLSPWVVLTPHAGELATLLTARGQDVDRARVEADPVVWARRAHELTGATVLVKGPTTVVVGVGGAVWAQADGPAWLATAGSGDVLAGLLGTLLAGCADEVLEEPELVAALAAAAALVHGRAAHRSNRGGPVHALGVAHALPATIAQLLAG
jgi:hydroxyethylthiazole kinase-like uncharacterized protein yjeF